MSQIPFLHFLGFSLDPYKRFVLVLSTLMVLLSFAGNTRAQNYALDSSFNAGVSDTPPNNYVSAIQPDGKILVGGDYERVNGVPRIGLVRLNTDGTIDPSFNLGGAGPNAAVLEIVLLADGKILIGGEFTSYNGIARSRLARLNADGTPDLTFSARGAGVNGVSPRITTLAIQSDGKIVVGGQGVLGYDEILSREVFRLNPDGSVDNTFISGYSAFVGVEQVGIQPDGKIVIVSDSYTDYNGVRVTTMIRVNPNGTLDLNYPVSTDGFSAEAIYGMAFQADGKIVIGGVFTSYADVPRNSLARVNPDGTLDTAFVPPAFSVYAETLAVLPDDKILISGGFDYANGLRRPLIRLNADGSLDNTFSLINTDSSAYHLATQMDGKVILTGAFTEVSTGETHAGIMRLTANGIIDNSFTTSFTNSYGDVTALAQQTDGKMLVGGTFITANGNKAHGISRFNPDGSFDSTFETGLGTLYEDRPEYSGIRAIAVQPDGKILAGGAFKAFNGLPLSSNLVRLNPDGSVDTSFNLSSSIRFQLDSSIEDIVTLPDGKILICGVKLSAATGNFPTKPLFRLNSDGSIDSSFNLNGLGSLLGGTSGYRIILQPDGKIIVGGFFSSVPGPSKTLARFNADGTRDTTFALVTGSNILHDAALQPDGKIVVGGGTFGAITGGYIRRINSNGTADTGFNSANAAIGNVNSIRLQPDGRVLIGGTFVSFGGVERKQFARLNNDGTLDTTVTSGFNDLFGTVNEMLLQPDGKAVIGGHFTNYDALPRDNVLRLVSGPPSSATPTPTSTATNTATPTPSPAATCTPGWLYDNGPIITDPDSFGANISSVQNIYGLNVYGFSAAATTTNRIADDFTVPAGGWTVNTVTFYAYQTGSTTTSTFDLAKFQIWDGPPNIQGSSVVFGDLTTNRYVSSSFSSTYRAYFENGSFPNGFLLTRPVMKIVANVGTTLSQGTYWIDFQLGGTGTAGPYVPPVTIDGHVNKPGSNGLQFTGAWSPLVDNGFAMAVQDVPFTINETCAAGTPTATPTPTNTPTGTSTSTPTNTATATPTQTPSVSGTITYGNVIGAPTPRFVSNVTVTGTGPSHIFTTTVFPNGSYTLTGFVPGTYTVTPTKTGGVNNITSFDAAKISQHVAAVSPLTGNQLIVADVSGNGVISSFDAAQVAKFVVATPPFGTTGNWIFNPVNRTYASLTTNVAGEDYSALLMGEVSGNWANTGTRTVGSNQLRSFAAEDGGSDTRQEHLKAEDWVIDESGGSERITAVIAPQIVTPADRDVVVPIRIEVAAEKGIIAYEFDLRYDPSVIQPQANSVDLAGTVSSRLSVAVGPEEKGLLRVAVYGPIPISSNGILLNLRFRSVGAPGSVSPLAWERLMLNEGEPQTLAIDGRIELSAATPDRAEISGLSPYASIAQVSQHIGYAEGGIWAGKSECIFPH